MGDYIFPVLLITALPFVLGKVLAYFGFVHAFKYRVERPRPMRIRRAALLTVALLGLPYVITFVFTVIVAVLLMAMNRSSFYAASPAWSLSSAIVASAIVWYGAGRWGAALRGWRLAGWTTGGILIQAGCQAGPMLAIYGHWVSVALILLLLVGLITAAQVSGRRPALKARFTPEPLCPRCKYDLTGNVSERCPECGAPVAQAA
ncbi:MAG: hypothetical protein ACYS0G_02610 [Planctomycetota bacterium]